MSMMLWSGVETDAVRYLQLKRKGCPAHLLNAKSGSAFEESYYGPAIAQKAGGKSVVKISGPLIDGSAGFLRFFGYLGYEDIKGAVLESLAADDVDGILLYVSSPGGSVAGLEAASNFLREAGKAKPIVAYASSAASAAYWLASNARYITADETSQVGSIGVIAQITTVVDAMEEAGVKVHVFKSGSLKMAGNPYEGLSEEAAKYFQELVDDQAAIFYKQVATTRKMSLRQVKSEFGDGRVMLGARAQASKLVDSLGGMNAAMQELDRLTKKKKR